MNRAPPFCLRLDHVHSTRVWPNARLWRNETMPTSSPTYIATQVAPVPSSGIEKLETDTFKLQSFQTLTGVKFVITAEAGTPDLGAVLHEIYELYTDYVLKVLR